MWRIKRNVLVKEEGLFKPLMLNADDENTDKKVAESCLREKLDLPLEDESGARKNIVKPNGKSFILWCF